MASTVEVREVEQQYIAAVRERTSGERLAGTIRALLDENAVYRFLKDATIEAHGHNVFVYWDEEVAGQRVLVLEVGVQVAQPFTGTERVQCSSTPAGRVATMTHTGAYEALGRTHEAIIAWCRAQGLERTGMRWEVYGRWNDDPAKRITEVFYLLK